MMLKIGICLEISMMVLYTSGKKEDALNIQKILKCKKSAITKIMSSAILDIANHKRKELDHLKYFLK